MDQETLDEDRYWPIQHILRNPGGEWITLYTHAEDENGQLVVDGFDLHVCGPQTPAVTPSSPSTPLSPPPPSPPPPTPCEQISGPSTGSLPDFSTPPSRMVSVVRPSLSPINLPPYTRSLPPQLWPDSPVPWTPDTIPQPPPSLTAVPNELITGELTYSQHRHLEWWLRQTQTDPPRHPNRISPLQRQQFRLPAQRDHHHHHRHDRDDSCARTGLHRAVRGYQVSLNERGNLRGGARWDRDESSERERERGREQDERDVQAAVWYGQRAEAELQRPEEITAEPEQRRSVNAFLMPPTPPTSPPWSAVIPAPPPSHARSASPLSSSRRRSSQTADIPAHLSSLRPTRSERPSALNIPSASDFIPSANLFQTPSSQVNAIMERFGLPSARQDRVSPTAARSHRDDAIRRTRIRQALYSPSEYSQTSPEGLQPSNSSTSDPASNSDSESEESWATPMMGRSPTSSVADTVIPRRTRSTPSIPNSPRSIQRDPSLTVSPVSRLSRGADYIPSRDPFLTPVVSPLTPSTPRTRTPSLLGRSRLDSSIRSRSSFDNPFRSPYQTNGNPFIDPYNGGVAIESITRSYHLNHDEDTNSFANTDNTTYNDDIDGSEGITTNSEGFTRFPASIPGHGTRHTDSIYHHPLPPQYIQTRTDAPNRSHTRNYNLNSTPALTRHLAAPRTLPTSPTSPSSPTSSTILRNPSHPPPNQPFPAENQERGDGAEEDVYQDTDEEIYQQILSEHLDLSVLDEDEIRWLRGMMERERVPEQGWDRGQHGDDDQAEDTDEPRWLTETINRNRARIQNWDVRGDRGAVRAEDRYGESPRLGVVNGVGQGRFRLMNGDGVVNGDTLVNGQVNGTPQRQGMQWGLRNGSVHDGDGGRDGGNVMTNGDNQANGVNGGNRVDGFHGPNGVNGINITNSANIPNINDENTTTNHPSHDTALPRLTRQPTLPRQPTPQHPTLPRHHRRGGIIPQLTPQEQMYTQTNGLRIREDDADGGMMGRDGMRARDGSGGNRVVNGGPGASGEDDGYEDDGYDETEAEELRS